MPKLKAPDMERNRLHIEAAALRVFIRQGYHGTTIRDIAREADVSMGNIYNYYRTKEELYVSIIRAYARRMVEIQEATVWPHVGRMDSEGLARLAEAVRQVVYKNPDYWRLMYIDVVEFGNRHFAHSFRRLSKTLQKSIGQPLAERTGNNVRDGIDPALATSAIYLQFFSYFLVEKLFGGKQHLGLPDSPAMAQLIRIFTEGLWPDESRNRKKGRGVSK
jgi:AcrR family transcriptional regulator